MERLPRQMSRRSPKVSGYAGHYVSVIDGKWQGEEGVVVSSQNGFLGIQLFGSNYLIHKRVKEVSFVINKDIEDAANILLDMLLWGDDKMSLPALGHIHSSEVRE